MQWQYVKAVSIYILFSYICFDKQLSIVYRYVPVNEEPERSHLRYLQKYYTQQIDQKLIEEWIFRLALHLGWNPDTFLDPYVESSDEEESESEEEEAPPEVIIAESSEFLLDDYMPLQKGIYVDMSSDLVEVQEDVVAYGQDEEFLFDQDNYVLVEPT